MDRKIKLHKSVFVINAIINCRAHLNIASPFTVAKNRNLKYCSFFYII